MAALVSTIDMEKRLSIFLFFVCINYFTAKRSVYTLLFMVNGYDGLNNHAGLKHRCLVVKHSDDKLPISQGHIVN